MKAPAPETAADGPPPPRRNPRLLGQDAAETTLLEAYRGGRLAHAWLLTGPAGIGKATLAFRFARYILADAAPTVTDDGLFGPAPSIARPSPPSLHVGPEHPVFQRVAASGHADLRTVERTVNEKTEKLRSEIVVDDVREVGGFLSLTAAEGGWRIVIIDVADEMNRTAANAVLKVLEEPPTRAILLLVSHNPGRLLPTIRSRCRRLPLQPLPTETVMALLQDYRPDLEEAAIADLARLADGSIGRALTLAQEGGLDVFDKLAHLFESLPELDIPALSKLAERIGKTDADASYQAAVDLVLRWLNRVLGEAAEATRENTGLSGREAQFVRRIAGFARLDRWLEVWDKIATLLRRTESSNLDRKQVFLNVFLTIETAVRR
ncbi:MAG: DNA polymerase III subunit delta' [Rhodospirillales bacterium]|nr:DNA polymerase III subunit delta' [Rhodospirillales bacterium]